MASPFGKHLKAESMLYQMLEHRFGPKPLTLLGAMLWG
jgi:hypothetical protein